MKFLKKEGKGTVTHKPRLNHRFNEDAMVLAYHCLKALQCRDDPVKLKYHQKHIPPSRMNRPHELVQNYLILQTIQYGVRRGKEGLAELKAGDFKPLQNEIWDYKSWQNVVTEVSKNHGADEETTDNFGEIPYLDIMRIEDGGDEMFNPGQFMEEARDFYDPLTEDNDNDRLGPVTGFRPLVSVL